MMEKTPIVIDFDGTIYEHKFPDIGEPTPGVKEALETIKRPDTKLLSTSAGRRHIGKASFQVINRNSLKVYEISYKRKP
ncbi:MAG: hypothetical protein HW406_1467 [Candidatus Brocadiaceae bacterium]|nr:hypothetical protein [Candidatus Brocadiaceae bacterium]